MELYKDGIKQTATTQAQIEFLKNSGYVEFGELKQPIQEELPPLPEEENKKK
jgi:hypothetical protein